MYTEFDLAKANALLDQIGLKWDAKHEYRLGPDGKSLEFNKIFYVSWPPNQGEVQDLIKQTWKQVGINVNNRPIERSLWEQTMRTNDWDMSAYATNTGGGAYLITSSDGVFPIDIAWYPTPQWGVWLQTQGKSGMEPPPEVKKLYQLYEEFTTTATPARMVEIEKEAFKIYVENLMAIGVCSRPTVEIYYVTSNRFRNVPDLVMDDVTFYNPASFYIAK